ncbi:MAG: hypothetical protein COY80_01465, partial [Candidatus Pacebacteria bacterium CG_4_10_14_0_8_um_filter_42_14]
MLKKNVVLTFILSFGLLSLPYQVRALEIVVDNGSVTFYQDTVLGEKDDARESSENLEKREVQKREEMTSRQKQLIRVKSEGEKIEVELRPVPTRKSTNPIPEVREKLERIEQIESDRVSLEFESQERDTDEAMTKESVMIRSKNQDSANHLEIESRDIKAKIRAGAEFELNSETNEVTLITPSGEEHILKNLPDQAIERMQKAGLLVETSQLDTELVSVAVNSETNAIEYRQKVQRAKKFLGLFNREVESEIVLNDSTSEVSEE